MDNADAGLTLSSGMHELTAAMREDGLRLDKLLLTTDSSTPSGTGPAESASQTMTTTQTAPQLGTHVIAYDYDPLYRLTEAVYSGDEYNATHAYAFDAVGNRTAYTTTITNTTVITYQYNAANQLVESVELGGDTTTYDWDDAGRLITTTVGANVSRVYTYSQDGDLREALVDGLLTTFVYDGDGHRLQMSVAGEVTTYTLDYGAEFRVLYEQGGAFAETKHYLYGSSCIGEEVDADNPTTQEWRYYLYDSNSNVRQTTNAQAEVTLAWKYSPEGIVLFGEEGPVTHLVCEGNGIYDFSTGLIFKNGNYFDPNTGIWIVLGSIGVWNSWHLDFSDRKRKDKRSKRKFFLLILLLFIFLLAGCAGGRDVPEQVSCTPIAEEIPTPNLPSNVLLFGGLGPSLDVNTDGPDPQDQLPYFSQIATESEPYPRSKQTQANNMSIYDDEVLIIGYSAGADAALIYANDYMNTHPNQVQEEGRWKITGVALLEPTGTGTMSGGGSLATEWNSIIDRLLQGGTDIYYLNDNGDEELSIANNYTPPGATGDFYRDDRNIRHYDPENCGGNATNNSISVRDDVINWFRSH
jgi:YD repeat-containing protein